MFSEKIRNIAVVVAGTDEEYQSSILSGIAGAAGEFQMNISVFASFGAVLPNQEYDIGEYNIYSLINYEQFDGAILLTNTICSRETRVKVCRDVIDSGIPAVVFDNSEHPEFYNIRIDNQAAMRKITEHILDVHGARVINYISGTADNPEAEERLCAFCDVMKEHGLPVEEPRVFYGTFRPDDGRQAVEELLESGLPLPDAIIAANDAMGLEAASTLIANGIRVPEDVIVTGFDWTFFARNHNPTLTSVSRPLEEAGRTACLLLDRILRGEPCEKTVTLQAEPVYQESCGCRSSNDEDIRNYRSQTYDLIQRFRTGTSMIIRMTSALSMNETPEQSIRIISQYLHEIGCRQCCICLCEGWENAFSAAPGDIRQNGIPKSGYPETMLAPLIWEDGKIGRVDHFESKQMYPVPLESSGNISYFFPMHFRSRCLGYYIFTNTEFPTRSMLCHLLMINISHSFENLRKLLNLNQAIIDLDRMFIIDPLCGVYNRNGFKRSADKIFHECCRLHTQMMIAFIDMDGLKYINDNFGHDEGDCALKALAKAIQQSCIGDRICARVGGDEFVVIGSDCTQADADRLETQITRRLEELNEGSGKPYSVSASIGTYITEITEDMKLYTLISYADQKMYRIKKDKHSLQREE